MSRNRIIFETAFGSHLYGTNGPNSDLDYRGVAIPDGRDILLGRAFESIQNNTKKNEGGWCHKNMPHDVDSTTYSLQKFIRLCGVGDVGALDMLFSPIQCWRNSSPEWSDILANRKKLVTRNPAGLIGYVTQQAGKYGIKGSRVSAVRKALDVFKSGDSKDKVSARFCDIEHVQDEFVRIIDLEVKAGSGTTVKALEVCGRKILGTNSVKEALNILTKIDENYGHRAKLAATNEGVDWKALSHAVRCIDEVKELLTTGRITFPLVRADFIKKVKAGELPYAEVAELLEAGVAETKELALKSTLPDQIDNAFWEEYVITHYGNAVMKAIGHDCRDY